MNINGSSKKPLEGPSRAEAEHDTCGVRAEYFASKAWLARVAGAVLLVISSPLILVMMILVRCTSPGPGLYRQSRVGKDGKIFTIYKIRTMCRDAERNTGAVWCTRGDARVTRVGRVLRFLHLDELPQLVNVARGEMALIGPRPERPEIVAVLREHVSNYDDRLRVLPGVTGLAQINLPPDETLDGVHNKVLLDRLYMAQACVSLDLRILACTFLRMLGIRYGVAVQWFGVGYSPERAQRLLLQEKESHHETLAPHVVLDDPVGAVATNLNGRKSHIRRRMFVNPRYLAREMRSIGRRWRA